MKQFKKFLSDYKEVILLMIILWILLVMVFGLFHNKSSIENNERTRISQRYNIYDYVDPETGVHYLMYGYDPYTLSVRYNSDGSIMVDDITK